MADPKKKEELNETQKKLRSVIAYITDFKNILAFKILYDKIGGNKWLVVFKDFFNKFKLAEFKTMFDGIYLKEYFKTTWAWVVMGGLAVATAAGGWFAWINWNKTTEPAKAAPPAVTQPATPAKPITTEPKKKSDSWVDDFLNQF